MSKTNPEKDNEKSQGRESVFDVNRIKFQNEMIHMKEDILRDIKTFERNFSEKFSSSNKVVGERLENFEQRLEGYNQRIFKISQSVVEDRVLKEKINLINQQSLEYKDQIMTLKTRLENLESEYSAKIESINNILNDSVIYPGIIGTKCKFGTFHEFMDYVLSQLAKFYMASQKNSTEIGIIKNRLDTNIKSVRGQIEGVNKTSINFTKKYVNDSENRLRDLIHGFEVDINLIKENNEKRLKELESSFNDKTNEIKKELDEEKNINKENNDKNELAINNNEKEINELKENYNKLNNDVIDISKRIIFPEQQSNKDDIKDNNKIDNINNDNNIDKLNDENEILNKYKTGEITKEQYLIYKQFNKMNFIMKNYLSDFLEKCSIINKKRHSAKNRKKLSVNFASQLSSCFNNILSEISTEKMKRRTVNNLLNCLNLKLNGNNKEQNRSMINIRNNYTMTGPKTAELNIESKVKTYENDNNLYSKKCLGYKTFQVSNKLKNFRLVNLEEAKNNFNDDIIINKKNYLKEEDEIGKIKKEIENFNKNNIIIEIEKNRNEELRKIKEYNNKLSPIVREKLINKSSKIKKDLVNTILNNNKENENLNLSAQKIKLKDNIIQKIKNNIIKEEESKQTKLSKTLSKKKEGETNTISVTAYKTFKGKKYLSYEKSFDAKVKEKLISYDINYKEKMKKMRRGFNSDISFFPNTNIVLPKTQKFIEAENMEKIVNNLHSYLGENAYQNKFHFRRNSIHDMSQSTTRIRDNLFNKNLFG